MQVSAPEGLAHFPQMPTPQLVMYSMDPMMRSSDTTSRWMSKHLRTICSGPQLMKASRFLEAAGIPARTSLEQLRNVPVMAQAPIIGGQVNGPQAPKLVQVEKLRSGFRPQQEGLLVAAHLVRDLQQGSDSRSAANEDERAVLEARHTPPVRPTEQDLGTRTELRKTRA